MEIVLMPYEQAHEAGFEHIVRREPDFAKIQGRIGYRQVLDVPEVPERVSAYGKERRPGARGTVCLARRARE